MKKVFWLLLCCLLLFSHKALADPLPAPGIYQLPVELRHATQDRASMGAAGLAAQGELVVTEDSMTLYLQALPMEMASIRTSLAALYMMDGDIYRMAAAGVPTLTIQDLLEKRPQVFALTLHDQTPLVNVLVQPQVSIMGSTPIPSRLAMDWAHLTPLESAPLAAAFQAQPVTPATQWIRSASGISLQFQTSTPSMPMLGMEALKGDALQQVKSKTGSNAPLAFELSLTAMPETIAPAALNQPWQPIHAQGITIYFPKSLGNTLYQQQGSQWVTIPLREEGAGYYGQLEHLGLFAVTKGAGSPKAAAPVVKSGNGKAPVAVKVPSKSTANATTVSPTTPVNGKSSLSPVTPEARTEDETLEDRTEKSPEQAISAPANPLTSRENKGLIFLLILLYLMMIGGACYVLWRYRHPWAKEWARYRYIIERGEAMQ